MSSLHLLPGLLNFFSQEKFDKLKSRKHPEEIINYTGNTERYTSITKEELIEYDTTNQLSELFKNKIILLGYFIKYPPFVPSDLHFSPLNGQFGEKSFPDMYGVVIQANILSMILDGNYAKLASNTISYLCAFLITFLFLLYIIDLHSRKKLSRLFKNTFDTISDYPFCFVFFSCRFIICFRGKCLFCLY